MRHMDQLLWCGDGRKGNSSREHLACNWHGAQFLSPAIDDPIGHRSAMLIDNHSIMQRTRELYNCLYFGSAWSWRRIEDNNGKRLISNMGSPEGCPCIGCRNDLLQSKIEHTLAYLLALGETHTILAVYLVNTTATDAIMSMVL